jgi:hypothetical protein
MAIHIRRREFIGTVAGAVGRISVVREFPQGFERPMNVSLAPAARVSITAASPAPPPPTTITSNERSIEFLGAA